MKDSYYVIFNKNGIDRMLKTDRFDLKSGEYAVRMMLEVPDSVFVKPCIPTTYVTIPPESISRTIEAETTAEGDAN